MREQDITDWETQEANSEAAEFNIQQSGEGRFLGPIPWEGSEGRGHAGVSLARGLGSSMGSSRDGTALQSGPN